MKREREEAELEFARCLMLLSKFGKADHEILTSYRSPPPPPPPHQRRRPSFPSFQALGGHRASHKKAKLTESTGNFSKLPDSPSKPKTHRCSICGLEFPLGQALGGHMRRHRAAPNSVDTASTASKDHESVAVTQPPFLPALPVMKRSNSSKRVLSLDLSLALPMYQNDSELQMEKVTRPLLKCFI
uniref:C2H2-type domain-containing protein n=1 Tax=Salix viminalis TaxID=40686 RepID=A0A6N2KJK1_SALVM